MSLVDRIEARARRRVAAQDAPDRWQRGVPASPAQPKPPPVVLRWFARPGRQQP